MALIRCKQRKEKFAVGSMPTTGHGMLMSMPPLGVAVAIGIEMRTTLGWWALALAAVAFVVGVMAIHYIPWTVEYLVARRKKCPNCGAQSWSFPFDEGFGL